MATPRKALKSAKKSIAATLNRFTLVINDEFSTPFFDEYVSEAQAQRFMRLLKTIGPLPKPPKQKPAPPMLKSSNQYQQLTDSLVDLIEDPTMPAEAAGLLEDAAIDFINQHNAVNPKFVRKRFAQACMNAFSNEERSDV